MAWTYDTCRCLPCTLWSAAQVRVRVGCKSEGHEEVRLLLNFRLIRNTVWKFLLSVFFKTNCLFCWCWDLMNYRISGVKYCCVEIRQVLQKAVTFRKFRSCEIPNKMRLDSRKRKCGVDHSIWWRELIRVFWIFYIKCLLSKDEKICIQIFIYIYILVLYSCLLHGTGRAVGPWKHQLKSHKSIDPKSPSKVERYYLQDDSVVKAKLSTATE